MDGTDCTTRTDYGRLIRRATRFEEDGTDAFVLPETFDGMTDEDLAELEASAIAAFDAIHQSGETPTDDDLEAMESLADAAELIRTEQAAREGQATERAERAAAAASRLNPEAAAEEGDGSEGDGDGTDGEGESDGDGSEDGETEGEGADEGANQPEPVSASGNRSRPTRIPFRSAATRTQDSPEEEGTRVSLVAAAGDSQVSPGATIGMGELTSMVQRRFKGLPKGTGRHTFGLGAFYLDFPEALVASGDDLDDVLSAAQDQSRLEGGSLLAAGGWCGPSETMYEQHCILESSDGMLDVPEVTTARGGVRYFQGIDFSSIYSQVPGFIYTEAEDEVGDYDGTYNPVDQTGGGSKPCVRIPCPDPTEARLDLRGFCLRSGILQERAYPEIVRRFVEGALIAHGHRVSADVISRMKTSATAVAIPADTGGTIAPLLASVELQVTDYRHKHRMADNAVLECVLPRWVRGMMRSDLSKRLGLSRDQFSIADSMITQWFTERGVRPQFVYNFDDAFTGGAAIGGAAAATRWPASVPFLLYSAGTFAKVTQAVITVEGLMDSTLLEQNDRTAIFTEEGYTVIQRGCDARLVTVPVSPDGTVAAGADLSNITA